MSGIIQVKNIIVYPDEGPWAVFLPTCTLYSEYNSTFEEESQCGRQNDTAWTEKAAERNESALPGYGKTDGDQIIFGSRIIRFFDGFCL